MDRWRVGQHYSIHVYEGDRPVATFHDPADAQRAVDAVNRVALAEAYSDADTQTAVEMSQRAVLAEAKSVEAWRAVHTARADALTEAADQVAHSREHGLAPGEASAPVSERFEDWLRARAAREVG